MPTYNYRCSSCNATQEATHKMSEPGPSRCACGSELRRVFSAPGIQFKGSGSYRNDSRRTPAASQ